MSPNIVARNLKGENGGVFISDTVAHVPDQTVAPYFDCFLCLTAAVASLVADNIKGNAITAVSIPAGAVIYGHFTSITLASGSGIAYNKV